MTWYINKNRLISKKTHLKNVTVISNYLETMLKIHINRAEAVESSVQQHDEDTGTKGVNQSQEEVILDG
jgi:hypothetical protein